MVNLSRESDWSNHRLLSICVRLSYSSIAHSGASLLVSSLCTISCTCPMLPKREPPLDMGVQINISGDGV